MVLSQGGLSLVKLWITKKLSRTGNSNRFVKQLIFFYLQKVSSNKYNVMVILCHKESVSYTRIWSTWSERYQHLWPLPKHMCLHQPYLNEWLVITHSHIIWHNPDQSQGIRQPCDQTHLLCWEFQVSMVLELIRILVTSQ